MTEGDRSKRIRANIQRSLNDIGGQTFHSGMVYDSMHRIQRQICEEASALEKKITVTVPTSGEVLLPDDFIVEREITPDASTKICAITIEEADKLKRAASGRSDTSASTDTLFYYYKWGGKLIFLSSAGTAPSGESDVTLFYYAYPDDDTERISNILDPLVSSRWDTVLFYGAVADLNGEPKSIQRFEREFERVKAQETVAQFSFSQIPASGDYD